MNRQRVAHINNNPYDNDWWRMNPDSSYEIYMTSVMEGQWCIVSKNKIKQDKTKENVKRSNYFKREAHIIKRWRLHDTILSAVANLDSTDSILQTMLPLYSEILKEAFIHMCGNIIDFTNPKKQTVALDIERIWGKDIIKVVARKIAYLRGGLRMEQGSYSSWGSHNHWWGTY